MHDRVTAAGAPSQRPARSPETERFGKPPSGWRRAWFEVIFESETRAGRRFDLVLITVILASVLVVIVDSVSSYAARHGTALTALEWTFTRFSPAEYVARLAVRSTAVALRDQLLRHRRSDVGVADLPGIFLPRISCADRYPSAYGCCVSSEY